MKMKNDKKIIFATAVILILGLGGAALYFWLNDNGGNTKPTSAKVLAPLAAGCGNGLCEEGETFGACPTDCHNPGSSGPKLAALALSPADFPPPPVGTAWVIIYDQLLENDESRIWPTLQGQGALAIHNVVIRLAAPDDLAWDQWGHLEQFILAFPQNKVMKAFEAATGSRLAELAVPANLSIQELPDPAVGEKSKAFKITGQNGPSQWSQYVIFFIKKGFLEYITFSGEKYEYQVFPPLARTAADKIKVED